MSRRQTSLHEFERPEQPLVEFAPQTPQAVVERVSERAQSAVKERGVALDV